MKASGSYYYLTDSSQQVAGSTTLDVVVFTLSTRGQLGKLLTVTADNFDEVLGYDLAYNPNLFGLKKALSTVASIKVLRINHNPTIDNIYLSSADAKVTASNIYDFETIKNLEPAPIVAFGANQPGKWGSFSVKLFKNEDIAGTLLKADTGNTIEDLVLGTAKALDKSEATITIKEVEHIELTGIVLKAGSVTLHVTKETSFADGVYGVRTPTAGDLVGTVTIKGNTVTLTDFDYTDSADISSETQLSYTIKQSVSLFNIGVYEKTSLGYELLESVEATKDYAGTIKDIEIYLGTAFVPSTFAHWGEYFDLSNGTNGTLPSSDQLDLRVLDTSSANVLILNGITDVSLINAIAQKGETSDRSVFADAPAYTRYEDLEAWQKNLYATQYLVLCSLFDIETSGDIGEVYVWPSIKYLMLYAQMYATYGSINYPPAGYTTGNVAITKLPENDFASHRDELKTNKINYLWVDESAVIWEQRTRYAEESDLSYISTVFILRDLKNRVMSYMKKKPFRFTTPDDLLNINSNLTTILENMKTANFLVEYELVMPTYAEAQKSRENQIHIKVQVIKDGEVWDIFADLRNDLVS